MRLEVSNNATYRGFTALDGRNTRVCFLLKKSFPKLGLEFSTHILQH